MCYGEDLPALDFAGLHVACISGDNGAGKSTLLDSLTWALWGKARAKSDDDLIRLGCEEMEAVLEFAADEQHYRVIRRRKRGKRQGLTTLDFQISEGAEWRRLSGDTIGETQATISRVLRLEYDTFINSAFLLQGRADEFTGRKPAERKQVLADILGLNEYEALEQRAKDRSVRLTKQLDLENAAIERLQVEALRRDELVEALHQARENEATIQAERDDLQSSVEELREELGHLRGFVVERTGVVETIDGREHDRREGDERIGALRTKIGALEATVAQREEIERGYQLLVDARAARNDMDRRRDQAFRLNDEYKEWCGRLALLKQDLETRLQLAAGRLADLDERLGRRSELEAEHEQLRADLGQLDELRVRLSALQEHERELGERHTRLLTLQLDIAKLENEIALGRDSLLAAQSDRQAEIARLSPHVAAIEDLDRRRHETEAALLRFGSLEADLAVLRMEQAQLVKRDGELVAEYRAVEADGKQLSEKIRLLERGEGMCPVCGSPLGEAGAAQIVNEYAARRNELRSRITRIKREQRELEAALGDRQHAIGELEAGIVERAGAETAAARLELQYETALKARDELEKAGVTLRTIEEQLAERDYAHEQQRRLAELAPEVAALGTDRELRSALQAARCEIEVTGKRVEDARTLQQQADRIVAELAALGGVDARRPPLERECRALREQLESDDYGADERTEIARIVAAGQAVGYHKEEHLALLDDLEALDVWDERARELRSAALDLQPARDELDRVEARAAELVAVLQRQRARLAELDAQLLLLPEAERAVVEVERRHRELNELLMRAHRRSAGAEGELSACERAVAELEQRQTAAATLGDERAVFDDLVLAFGKKGVQAMLIETAIPELEAEANELLARMTDNQFHLAFETQRDTKRGDSTIETLDIRISDALGTRDYAMFSGGEAFRVNFALRIALSKLLARRAGANLKTLVLDEGFGSQDGHGRDRVVEAINSIQPDFERILVITHIEELKDVFGARIEVVKTAGGSVWSIA